MGPPARDGDFNAAIAKLCKMQHDSANLNRELLLRNRATTSRGAVVVEKQGH
jgi:hypothetical protein